MICRLLPHEIRDGPDNLALDESLLDSVDLDPSAAVLRTYEWSEPTLSLGYFQDFEAFRSDPRWDEVPTVRRPSGGGALWHDREVTYALIVPRSHPLGGRPTALYRAVHAAIAASLRGAGIAAERRGDAPGASRPSRPLLCFLDRDPEDILIGGRKVVGSAQRRRTSAVLQHGSLLLHASTRTPELPGMAELAGVPPEAERWSAMIREELPGALGLSAVRDALRDAEREATRTRSESVYRDSGWTERRQRPSRRPKSPLP